MDSEKGGAGLLGLSTYGNQFGIDFCQLTSIGSTRLLSLFNNIADSTVKFVYLESHKVCLLPKYWRGWGRLTPMTCNLCFSGEPSREGWKWKSCDCGGAGTATTLTDQNYHSFVHHGCIFKQWLNKQLRDIGSLPTTKLPQF